MDNKSRREKDVVLAGSLRRILADEFVLYSKMRIARWNVEGSDFYIKYNLFRRLYLQSEKAMSKIACQLVYMGNSLPTSPLELLSMTGLTDEVNEKRDSKAYNSIILNDIRLIQNSLDRMKNVLGFGLYYWDIGSFIDDLSDMHQDMISMLTEGCAGL